MEDLTSEVVLVASFVLCSAQESWFEQAYMIIWNENLKTGSDEIDRQHRILIDNINQLGCVLSETNPTKDEYKFLMYLMQFLESYTKEHFCFEEDCMERHRCPAHARNKEAHREFLKFFEQFKEDCRHKGFQPEIIHTLHQRMSSWIQEHILRVDVQLKPYLKVAGK